MLVIEIDNPPVNALSTSVAGELADAFAAAVRDEGVKAIVLACAGRTFVAGADVNELEAAARGVGAGPPDVHNLLAQIEDSTRPVVVAIHGTALGGGVELAMAGHYRVAAADARMGMPEVTLGIIPGAEGTQRLPRLVGIERAIALCVSGTPVSAAEAWRIGLIDRVIEGDIRTGAIAFARETGVRGGPPPRTRDRQDRLVSADVAAELAAAGRELARRTHPDLEAPLRVVDAIEAAASLSFADGCLREREIVRRQMETTEARTRLQAFFAERAARRLRKASGVQ